MRVFKKKRRMGSEDVYKQICIIRIIINPAVVK